MTVDLESQWRSAERLVRIYSWVTLAAVAYGVIVAHLPFIVGHPWSTCEGGMSKLACVLVFHLFDVPLVLFNGYVGWYGLKHFSRGGVRPYRSLVNFAVMANLAFFTFEAVTLLGVLRNGGAEWELWALASVALMLVGGAAFGIYLHQKLIALPIQPYNAEVNDADRSRDSRAELRRKSSVSQ